MKLSGKLNPQGINAGSMADIAFLLLIFFLVSTTIEQDVGINRLLSAGGKSAKTRNHLLVLVNNQDEIMVNGKRSNLDQLEVFATEFMLNPAGHPDKATIVHAHNEVLGDFDKYEGVISVEASDKITYERYIEIQDRLSAVFNGLRNQLASRKFGKDFKSSTLSKVQYEAIRKAIPISIQDVEHEDN